MQVVVMKRLQDYEVVRNLEPMTTALTQGGMIPEWTMGDRLRKAREAAGLEQQELAQKIGVARTTISNAEKGKVNPRQIVINSWSLATGVPVQWLQNGETPTGGPGGGNFTMCARRDSNSQPSDWYPDVLRPAIIARPEVVRLYPLPGAVVAA